MQTHWVKTDSIQLHIQTDGPSAGPPVILLHGFPEFHYGWHKQVPKLAAAGYRVIIPDQRGYNLSEKPKRVSAYHVDTLAQDVLAIIDHFGYKKVYLVGHDWGAAVAWTLAIQHPQRLEKLVILNVPHPDVMARFIVENQTQRAKSWYIFFFQLPFLPEWLLQRDNFRNLSRMLAGSGRLGTFKREDLQAYKNAWAQPGALTGMINWYRNIFRNALRAMLQKKKNARLVNVPTLILWGKKDVALSHEMVQPSLDLCSSGSAIFFEEATHWLQHDEPDAVNEHLIAFLR